MDMHMKKRYPPFTLDAHNLPNTRHPVKRSDKYFDAKPARNGSVTKSLSKSSPTHYSDRPHPNGKRSLKKQVGVGEMMYIHDNVLGDYESGKSKSSSRKIKKNIFDNNLFDFDKKPFNFGNSNETSKFKFVYPKKSTRFPKPTSMLGQTTVYGNMKDEIKRNQGYNPFLLRHQQEQMAKYPKYPLMSPELMERMKNAQNAKNAKKPKDSDLVSPYSYLQPTNYGLPLTEGLLRELNQRREKAEQEYQRQQEEAQRKQEEAQRKQEEYERRQEEILRLQEESYKQQSSLPSSAQSYSNQPWGGLGNYSIEDIYNYLYDNGYIE